jgi:hypothetical protein
MQYYQLNTVHLALTNFQSINQSIIMTYISLSLAKNYLIGEGGVQLPNTEPYVVFLGVLVILVQYNQD